MAKIPTKLSQLIPEIRDWPIHKLSEDRRKFVKEIDEFTAQRLKEIHPNKVGDLIAEAVYLERIRLKEEPWKVDPPNDNAFFSKIRKILTGTNTKSKEEAKATQEELLQRIIHRYSEEIVGTFRKSTFLFARRFLTFFFSRLLNAAAAQNLLGFWRSRVQLHERLRVYGEMEHIRGLFEKGTVIVLPTHYSNLDSILVGYAMDEIAGMPSFSYGAGLNLYNSGIAAYFMNRLGAYRVDRRKKNPIYLETLKSMSKLSVERGTNSLFFPGGTRSRSGEIEKRLKMGLMGTLIEAQRSLCQKESDKKIFIVPLVLGYHFVLEAPFLIEQHLKIIGKEHYYKSADGSLSPRELLRFVWQIFKSDNEILLSFGKPMDVFGNFVDEDGKSFDVRGNEVKIEDYYKSPTGEISTNLQREGEYTKILADKIVDRFYKENIVLSSHVIAFTAFHIFSKHNEKLDLITTLRLPADNYVFPIEDFEQAIAAMQNVLIDLTNKGKLKLSDIVENGSVQDIIRDGLENLGGFHPRKPLLMNKKGDLESDDFPTLYYYNNHLENYGIAKKIRWEKYKVETLDKE